VSELDPRALAGLDDVIAFGYDPSDDSAETDLWIECLNAASDEMHRVADREFVARNATRDGNDPIEVASQTRTVDVVANYYVEERDLAPLFVDGVRVGDGGGRRLLKIGDFAGSGGAGWPPDSEKPSAIRIYSYEGVLLETVDLATIVARPRNREPWEPVTELEFRGTTVIAGASYVEIDGKWGFPRVPPALQRACANQAAVWFARDVRHFSTTFSLESGRFEVVRDSLANAVEAVVDRFRERGLG